MVTKLIMNSKINAERRKRVRLEYERESLIKQIMILEKFNYQNFIQNDNDFIDLPDNGEIIEKDDPIFTIYTSANTYKDLKNKLKKKISTTRKHYNCYNIDI